MKSLKSTANVLRNLLRPGYAPVMLGKVGQRLLEVARGTKTERSTEWCQRHAGDLEAFAASLQPELWQEARQFGAELRSRAADILGALPVSLGGGGHYELLYFLTRLMEPEVAVETGVAAGFSTQAILSAMEANGRGHLYSTDFPYFRLAEPERFIGLLVDEDLRGRWTLYTRGDRDGLARITRQVSSIDLFHYDSDKRYSGRAAALRAVEGLLAADSLVIMDDIGDDDFFRDYITARGCPSQVVAFEGKYLGVAGQIPVTSLEPGS